MRSLIVALLLLSPACAHTTDHRADVCPESASLHCLTAPECSFDASRGCRVCQCSTGEMNPKRGTER